MVNLTQVEEQLKRAGCNYRFWGRAEIKELGKILQPGETIAHAVNGRYAGGFALLAVTDHRLLLIDRKPMFLSLEDIRFDMIAEIDYNFHLLTGAVHIITPNRKLTFSSWSQEHLREVVNYTQGCVMEMRQHFMQQQFQQQQVDAQATASTVGGLMMQGNQGVQQTLPMNPYTKAPLLMRRRRYPKFY
ncbi:MAG TPA: PH domain-containing protein [Nevskiaceae bacterium]|nr:PH domain-containing protein [Nevskiaceae bacterium]